jgi:hypothetical protein
LQTTISFANFEQGLSLPAVLKEQHLLSEVFRVYSTKNQRVVSASSVMPAFFCNRFVNKTFRNVKAMKAGYIFKVH